MPKAIDLRVPGLTFEDGLKRLANTPPPKLAKKAAKKPRRKK